VVLQGRIIGIGMRCEARCAHGAGSLPGEGRPRPLRAAQPSRRGHP
jgi:hypothetical protein